MPTSQVYVLKQRCIGAAEMDNADGLLCLEDMLESPLGEEKWTIGDSSHEQAGNSGCLAADFPVFDDADLTCVFEKECSHMPDVSYLKVLMQDNILDGARSNAVQWIVKVSSRYNFMPLTVALAINYLDRYLSKHLTKSWKSWMFQLSSVACLSLGAKMEEINVPMLVDLQFEGSDNIFDPKAVQRMELAVLSSLEWRMSSVTIFTFLDDLLQKLGLNPRLHKSLFGRVTELVIGTYSEAIFLEFRPSTISFAAIRCALEELVPLQAEKYIDDLIKKLPPEENMDRCYRLMEELVADPVGPLQSSSLLHGASKPPCSSPVNVAETFRRGNQCFGVVKEELVSAYLKRDGLYKDYLQTSGLKSRKRKFDVTMS